MPRKWKPKANHAWRTYNANDCNRRTELSHSDLNYEADDEAHRYRPTSITDLNEFLARGDSRYGHL